MVERIHVLVNKEQIRPEALEETVVVMDVMLATTTMITILERGASRIYPVSSVEEAWAVREQLGAEDVLTGGEEGGFLVDGFDFGPRPEEFRPELVRNKNIVFLSTNGTRAIVAAGTAERLLLASLRNAHAVAEYLQQVKTKGITLLCAGSGGNLSMEDFVCAGLILSRLPVEGVELNDAALVARQLLLSNQGDVASLIRQGRLGRRFSQRWQALLSFVLDVGASEALIGYRDGYLYDMRRA